MIMESHENASAAVPEEKSASLPVAESGSHSARNIRWAQAFVLAALFSAPALICVKLSVVDDPDVWWHLRTGEWILQHFAVPQAEPFSSFGAGSPWTAYSWLYEVIVFQLFQRLGLVGLVVYSTAMVALITVVLHRLIRRLQADFSIAVLLTFVAASILYQLFTPRPWLFTILFFALEVDLLMQARKTGKTRGLLWLPVLFALWANLHIQFIDGLLVLGIALAEAVLARWWTGIQARIRPGRLCGIFVACLLATMANPYGWRIYPVVYDLAAQSGVLNKVGELAAMPFRSFNDWCVLIFVLAAVSVLARARRILFFESALLAFAIVVSFRTQRDLWVAVIAASAILASEVKGDGKNQLRVKTLDAPLVAAGTALVLLTGFCAMRVDNARLSTKLAEALPVRAVEVVKEKGWSGPLYNDYTWGGYLIWALRMPVSMDGRQNVYGDEQIDLSAATWGGQPGWATDPNLQKAGLVIGPVKASLTQLLRMDTRFELAYEDKLAAVFVARQTVASGAAVSPAGSMAAHSAVK
jgi:hypothetical protein